MKRLSDVGLPELSLLAIALLFLAAAGACAGSGRIARGYDAMLGGDLERARILLEEERARHPDSFEARMALGEVYYRTARDALDRDYDEARYLAFLERAVDEFVRAVEIEPRSDRPHFYLAVVDAYRGDLDAALRGFQMTRRLHPKGITYTNIAEIQVYRGDLELARRWNKAGLRRGAGVGPVTFNAMLIQWSSGDLRGARRHFASLRRGYPEMIREINAAPLPVVPASFDRFAEYCCESPACGPYLENACRDMDLEVRHRRISNEAVLKELQIEMEKQRRLREIYQRKELDIEIDELDAPDPLDPLDPP